MTTNLSNRLQSLGSPLFKSSSGFECVLSQTVESFVGIVERVNPSFKTCTALCLSYLRKPDWTRPRMKPSIIQSGSSTRRRGFNDLLTRPAIIRSASITAINSIELYNLPAMIVAKEIRVSKFRNDRLPPRATPSSISPPHRSLSSSSARQPSAQ